MFDEVLKRWHLDADGAVFHTPGSDLLPVRTADGRPAMLKRARAAEERAGLALMVWWAGDGAAPVLAHDDDVLLMMRATGPRDLLAMSIDTATGDDAATDALCDVLARLHAPRAAPAPPLAPLADWFRALHREAAQRGGIYEECARLTDALLASPQEVIPLHGDCHHHNVLDFGDGGWRAIDPKDRIGERGFDHAQILCNPDLPHAADPARFRRQLARVSARAGFDPRRLAQWTAARAALSAAWFLEDAEEDNAARDIDTARTALDWLRQAG